MNQLLSGMQQVPTTQTTNGDGAHVTTWNANLDLFAAVGSMRKTPGSVVPAFKKALSENEDLAVRIALWARDIRGGAGERNAYRLILSFLANGTKRTKQIARDLIALTHEVGRWDDLLVLMGTDLESDVVHEIAAALNAKNALCAKWMPRKGPIAGQLVKAFGLSPRQYRKMLVALTNVVETKMCAKEWETIEFGKLPSLASARYQKAFTRNAPKQYEDYVNSLVNGEAKINAAAIFPHDILQSSCTGRDDVATEQWKALPDYMGGSDRKVLAMVDVSGSMGCGLGTGGYSVKQGAVTCMTAAVALGIYCAERNNGPFKDHFVTFTDQPTLVKLSGSLKDKWNQSTRHVGYSTNFDAAFKMILQVAVRNNVPAADMPDMLLVLSDMQFNPNSSSTHMDSTANQRLKVEYEKAGYEMPKMVYWNLNASAGNHPVTMHDNGTGLVSGFSPSIMTSVLAAKEFNPMSLMLDTVMVPRYNWKG